MLSDVIACPMRWWLWPFSLAGRIGRFGRAASVSTGGPDSSACFPVSAGAQSPHGANPEPALEKQGPQEEGAGGHGSRMQDNSLPLIL